MANTTLREYYGILNSHDWYYSFSDDYTVYRKGRDAQIKIEGMAEQSEEHKKLYSGFKNHYFSGPAWGSDKAPLPEVPK